MANFLGPQASLGFGAGNARRSNNAFTNRLNGVQPARPAAPQQPMLSQQDAYRQFAISGFGRVPGQAAGQIIANPFNGPISAAERQQRGRDLTAQYGLGGYGGYGGYGQQQAAAQSMQQNQKTWPQAGWGDQGVAGIPGMPQMQQMGQKPQTTGPGLQQTAAVDPKLQQMNPMQRMRPYPIPTYGSAAMGLR